MGEVSSREILQRPQFHSLVENNPKIKFLDVYYLGKLDEQPADYIKIFELESAKGDSNVYWH